ncbi:hypothetical protein XELAEV_18025405mg, partial [Xenopus laevis]
MGSEQSKLGEGDQKGISAFEIVKRREGKQPVNDYIKLAKLCGFNFKGPRLQPDSWYNVVKEQKGVLQDKGLLPSAQAWFRVAKGLQKEGWSEQRVIQSDGNIKYLYHREPPFHCMVNTTNPPPPYKDVSQELPPAPSEVSIEEKPNRTKTSDIVTDSDQSTTGEHIHTDRWSLDITHYICFVLRNALQTFLSTVYSLKKYSKSGLTNIILLHSDAGVHSDAGENTLASQCHAWEEPRGRTGCRHLEQQGSVGVEA